MFDTFFVLLNGTNVFLVIVVVKMTTILICLFLYLLECLNVNVQK